MAYVRQANNYFVTKMKAKKKLCKSRAAHAYTEREIFIQVTWLLTSINVFFFLACLSIRFSYFVSTRNAATELEAYSWSVCTIFISPFKHQFIYCNISYLDISFSSNYFTPHLTWIFMLRSFGCDVHSLSLSLSVSIFQSLVLLVNRLLHFFFINTFAICKRCSPFVTSDGHTHTIYAIMI